MKECCFCNDLEIHGANVEKIIPELQAKLVVAETPNMFAFAEAHPIVDEEYYLLTPKEHYQAFSHLPTHFSRDMNGMIQYLTNGNEFIMFEHGELADKVKVKSVLHAHTHLILTNNMLESVVEKTEELGAKPRYVHFDEYSTIDTLKDVVGDNGYFMFREGEHGFVIPENDVELPSQFFRMLVDDIKNPEVPFPDWKNPSEEDVLVFQKRLTNLKKEIKK